MSNFSNLLLCRFAGVEGPDGYRACEARLLVIDGFSAPNASQVKVAAGTRRITTFCQVLDFTYLLHKPDKSYSQKYEVDVSPGGRYRVEPFWDGAFCRVHLIDESGNQLPMRDVLAQGGA